MKKLGLMLAVAPCAILFATPAAASIVSWDVTTAGPGFNAKQAIPRPGEHRFQFQDGSTFSIDTSNLTGTFTATAINDLGDVATFALNLSGYEDTLPASFKYVQGNGLPYDGDHMNFFTNAQGTITINGAAYSLNPADPLKDNSLFQFGIGANAKNSDLGGSAWFNMLDPSGNALTKMWDLNFSMDRSGTAVPAPAGLALFGLGLIGLWGARRRKAIAAA